MIKHLLEIFQGQGALWFWVWHSKAVLDISLGLEMVEWEAQADDCKPGIYRIIHENKLYAHELSPNQTGECVWDIPNGAFI